MAFNFLIEVTSLIPLSETFTNSAGILSAKDRLVSRETLKVLRLRLLTPIKSMLDIIDFSNSFKLCTSNKTSRPKLLAVFENDKIS